AVYTPYYEGDIMALYAAAIGIPKNNIFSETKAEHSTENLYYSYKKARNMGFKRIALASDPFQTKQLRRYARNKVNAEVGLIPMVGDIMLRMKAQMTDPVIDYQRAFNKEFIIIKKRQSFWKRLRGTMGKNVDVNAYEKKQD
ncbi:MAG: YdcF family protein, partial [Flavitalea sp.]